ncbi:hypothetical protein PISMIDRAFT_409279 [Pisolithus microcarpus 441]|uniref:Uncharacterized protein n=1 Tax=Pisolithus microcarpus 441 TaxID=765257 RepID=A0A0C9ZQ53_9AGAM|nr:hypothetical protein PISMIDRAFT_409279 [Pisolithus microcarpus 441]
MESRPEGYLTSVVSHAGSSRLPLLWRLVCTIASEGQHAFLCGTLTLRKCRRCRRQPCLDELKTTG